MPNETVNLSLLAQLKKESWTHISHFFELQVGVDGCVCLTYLGNKCHQKMGRRQVNCEAFGNILLGNFELFHVDVALTFTTYLINGTGYLHSFVKQFSPIALTIFSKLNHLATVRLIQD